MRKTLLSFIITMSIAMTSGVQASLNPQQLLEQTLLSVGADTTAVEIMVWYPDNSEGTEEADNGSLPDGWEHWIRRAKAENYSLIIEDYKASTVVEAATIYTRERTIAKAKGGGASLKLSAVLPAASPANKGTGQALLLQLGGDQVVQEIEEGSLYSAASLAKGWGPPITVGNDQINLQLVLKPDAESGLTRLYLTAPVIIGDL